MVELMVLTFHVTLRGDVLCVGIKEGSARVPNYLSYIWDLIPAK